MKNCGNEVIRNLEITEAGREIYRKVSIIRCNYFFEGFIHPSILSCMTCSINKLYSIGFNAHSEYFDI